MNSYIKNYGTYSTEVKIPTQEKYLEYQTELRSDYVDRLLYAIVGERGKTVVTGHNLSVSPDGKTLNISGGILIIDYTIIYTKENISISIADNLSSGIYFVIARYDYNRTGVNRNCEYLIINPLDYKDSTEDPEGYHHLYLGEINISIHPIYGYKYITNLEIDFTKRNIAYSVQKPEYITSPFQLNPIDILNQLLNIDGHNSGLDADTIDGYHANEFVKNEEYTPENILNKIKLIDGHNSGLDADTIDGIHKSTIVETDQNKTITGKLTFNPQNIGSPFNIGQNALNQLVVGLNADTIDGYHANEFELAGSVLNHEQIYDHNNIGKIKDVEVDDSNKGDNKILVYNATLNKFVYENKLSTSWGQITGTLTDQIDLKNALDSKASVNHNHALSLLIERSYNSLTDKPDLSSLHSHPNKALLDSYTNTNSDISNAITNSHSHPNKALLDSYTNTNSDISNAITNSHSHPNKALLDSYTNTNSDISNAITNSHSHPNKILLDNYNPNNFALAIHTHGDLVYQISQKADINHNHNNLYYSKDEIDSLLQGLKPKQSVKVATTENITLSGIQTIDGISLSEGDRVLVKDQTDLTQNGIYVVTSNLWIRALDANTWDKLVSAYVFVEEGVTNADTAWVCTIDSGGTLEVNDITWIKFSNVNISLNSNLTSFANLTTNGIIVKASEGNIISRQIDVSGNGISIINSDGIDGDPTIIISADTNSTANTLVYRDDQGNFSANLITASEFISIGGDLAEKYTIKGEYEVGDVICISQSEQYDCEISNEIASQKVIGVISFNPGLKMNKFGNGTYVALKGKVLCKIYGKVNKGDPLVSYYEGKAISINYAKELKVDINKPGIIFAKALQNGENNIIEVIVL